MTTHEDLFAVMATPSPVPPIVDRAHWPAHVTVAGNFRIDGSAATTIPALLESSAHRVTAFSVRLGPAARFGVASDVPVLLAPHPSLDQIHEFLAAGLVQLPGFGPMEPHHWRYGYRPHVTLGLAVHDQDGDVLPIRFLTLVSLHGRSGRRRFAVDLR